jgi:hypothetical protein
LAQRWLAIAVPLLLLLTGLAAMQPGSATPATSSCVKYHWPGIGTVCDRGPHDIEIFDATGKSWGTVHRPHDAPKWLPDVTPKAAALAPPAIVLPPIVVPPLTAPGVPGPGQLGFWVSTCPVEHYRTWPNMDYQYQPNCINTPPEVQIPSEQPWRNIQCADDAPGEYRIRMVYVRAFDDGPTWGWSDDAIRWMALWGNDKVNFAGMDDGMHADWKMECSQGQMAVHRVTTWTPLALTSASSILMDIARQSDHLTDTRIKYWIYFDDRAPAPTCSCAGLGVRYGDTTGDVTNMNNGNAGVQWALSLDFGGFVIAHEGGHTLGAVQYDAPHCTGAAHCWDSNDIMCYDDGGPFGSLFGTGHNCPSFIAWDCPWTDDVRDDYFSVAPTAGRYLDTKWNIGAPYNRYGVLDASTVYHRVLCEPSTQDFTVGQTVTCSYAGGNPEATQVRFEIDWGDGTVTQDPPLGLWYPETKVRSSASHVYTTPGTYRIHVYAWDDAASNRSNGVPWDLEVHALPGVPTPGGLPVGIGLPP